MIHQSVTVEEALVGTRLLRLHSSLDHIQGGHETGRDHGSTAGGCHLLEWPNLKARIVEHFLGFLWILLVAIAIAIAIAIAGG